MFQSFGPHVGVFSSISDCLSVGCLHATQMGLTARCARKFFMLKFHILLQRDLHNKGLNPKVASVPEGHKVAQQPLVSIIQGWVNNINIYRAADSIRHINIAAFRPIFVLSFAVPLVSVICANGTMLKLYLSWIVHEPSTEQKHLTP